MRKKILGIRLYLRAVTFTIEKIINIDKRGYTYFNSFRNYKNTERTFKNNGYSHYFKW